MLNWVLFEKSHFWCLLWDWVEFWSMFSSSVSFDFSVSLSSKTSSVSFDYSVSLSSASLIEFSFSLLHPPCQHLVLLSISTLVFAERCVWCSLLSLHDLVYSAHNSVDKQRELILIISLSRHNTNNYEGESMSVYIYFVSCMFCSYSTCEWLCHICYLTVVHFINWRRRKKKMSQDKKQYSVVAVLDGRRTGMESGFVMRKQSLILTRRHLTYLKLN